MVSIALSSSMGGILLTWYWICPRCRGPIGGRAKCRRAVGGQRLKDLRKFIRHRIPLFLEGLFIIEKQCKTRNVQKLNPRR